MDTFFLVFQLVPKSRFGSKMSQKGSYCCSQLSFLEKFQESAISNYFWLNLDSEKCAERNFCIKRRVFVEKWTKCHFRDFLPSSLIFLADSTGFRWNLCPLSKHCWHKNCLAATERSFWKTDCRLCLASKFGFEYCCFCDLAVSYQHFFSLNFCASKYSSPFLAPFRQSNHRSNLLWVIGQKLWARLLFGALFALKTFVEFLFLLQKRAYWVIGPTFDHFYALYSFGARPLWSTTQKLDSIGFWRTHFGILHLRPFGCQIETRKELNMSWFATSFGTGCLWSNFWALLTFAIQFDPSHWQFQKEFSINRPNSPCFKLSG